MHFSESITDLIGDTPLVRLRRVTDGIACTVLASVYKTSPVGLKYTAGLPADVAAHLQAVAWETSQSFHAREGRGAL